MFKRCFSKGFQGVFILLTAISLVPFSSSGQQADCVRGEATPVIRVSVFPKSVFSLQPDSLTAIETVTFDNGDRLIINNWGCTWYTLTFRFETSRFKADTGALKYWYLAAYRLVNEIKNSINAPIDIEKGIQALNGYLSRNAFALKLQDEIDFGGKEIRDIVMLERISRIGPGRYAVTLSFATGPL
jgi:hypothetical protein